MTEPSWRAEARAMTEAVPYARSQRIRRRLRQRAEASTTRTRRHWSAIAAFAAGAALVMLSVLVLRPTQVEIAPPRSPASTPAPLAAATERSEVSPRLHASGCTGELAAPAEAKSAMLIGPCELAGPGLRVAIADTATMGGDARSIVLDAGEIELDVDPRHRRDVPFSVTTPAGRIEVTGTRFTVRHHPDGGAVTVHEGQVRLAMAGQIRHVDAGERVTWAAEGPRYQLVTPEDEPASRAPSPERRATRGEAPTPAPRTRRSTRRGSSGALIEEVERLRAAGRFAEAASTIEAALPSLTRRDREVLSFELGKLTERSRGKAAACDHWRTFERDFERGRYMDLVAEERARLGCDQTPLP